MNKDVIAVNQDSLGIQALKYMTRDSVEVWIKPLKGGDWAVCFLNRSRTARTVDFDWQKEIIHDSVANRTLQASATNYSLQNLWTKKAEGDTRKPFKAVLPAHDVALFRLHKQ